MVLSEAVELNAAAELQRHLAAKLEEADALRALIEQAKLDQRQLRLQLQSAGLTDVSLIPGRLQAGSGGILLQHIELRSMLEWLVERVDLERHMVFECGPSDGEITVGGRHVQLQRMATWPVLPETTAAGLKLSVPLDMEVEIAEMLTAARAHGSVSDLEVQRLAEVWEMVGAEVASAQVGRPEPAVFLVRRDSTQAMIVGHWPVLDFGHATPSVSALFDPVQHFRGLAEAENHGGSIENKELERPCVNTGDRVEVEYRGQWFSGLLQGVDNNLANIQCDVDSPGVITVAPLTSVRPARRADQPEQKKMQRHMRARSLG
mmetsp:Transcript_9252/g.21712  ORF Transcript_9252/g.21712 Transcript_9252/m.21712 type:complete len:319 (+) Transcript_9252:74-1030(+)|eukprot:CAMPEP_0171093286 /NCGR_PEP_ID=MMETSP0766_2-20121228/38991_1 /TAXON_ID=439317 /ORGANISM="Gambierdiscus australes, Strain CAWD 149" /LENGTH=318 /DNA_ID=CAMNT_0011551709 /DNA_START=73 /DNA_END=1029 /DNA_ORIENTATION=-